jgi:hypothetical protein
MTALNTDDRRRAAFAAIAQAAKESPDWLLEVHAAKIMREATGLQQVEVGPAIRWAIAHPEVTR